MHIHQALAALANVQSFVSVAGTPLTATPTSSIAIASTGSHRSSDQALALISSPTNGSVTPPRQTSNIGPQSNTTLIPPQGLIPYRVRGSSTTLFFHSFGITIPSSYMLQCLSLSLTLILQVTLDGRGKDLISNGYFNHTHLMRNGAKVAVVVGDFREVGRPMDYYNVRDMLSGIGDFVTEPDRGITTLSYEIEVDNKGYVGTGHVDYEPAPSSA